MRRHPLLITLALAALGLAGCSSGDEDASATTSTTSATPTSGGSATNGGGTATTGGAASIAEILCEVITEVEAQLGEDASSGLYVTEFGREAISRLDLSDLPDIGSAEDNVRALCPAQLDSFLQHAGLQGLPGL